MVDTEMQELVKPEGMPPLQWEWWKEWWAQDYSWNSERFEPYKTRIIERLQSGIPGSISEGDLIAQGQLVPGPQGELFHICWLPPYWKDGTKTDYYSNPYSVRERAKDVFRSCLKDFTGKFAGLTSTFTLMAMSSPEGILLSHLEQCFVGGSFIRSDVGSRFAIQMRSCLFAFGGEEGEIRPFVRWNVWLYKSTFSTQETSGPWLNFTNVDFTHGLNLSDCNIENFVNFNTCNFDSTFFLGENPSGNVKPVFEGALQFSDCVFSGQINANKTNRYTKINFLRCDFKGKFGAKNLRVHRTSSGILSFAESTFEKKVTISAENLIEVAPAFEDSTLKKGIDFGPFEAVLDRKFFKMLREEVQTRLDFLDEGNLTSKERQYATRVEIDIELRRLIAGVRVIRLASQSGGDKLSEAQLHAMELAAYRRLSTTGLMNKLFACMYSGFSDYGCSLSKPVIWWFGALFLAGFLYALLNECAQLSAFQGPLDFGEIWEGMLYSLSRVIPVGPWQDLVFADSILSTTKGASTAPSSGQKIAVVVLASLQSLFSAILLFLFGLAARRKFQVG